MRPAVMIIDHVSEVRLPPDHADDHVAAAVPARGDVADRRDVASAPPRHRPAAPSGAPPEPELGGPGPARDVVRRDTDSVPAQAAVAGHPGHDHALAPRHRPAPLGGPVHARQARPPGDPPEHHSPGPPAGPGCHSHWQAFDTPHAVRPEAKVSSAGAGEETARSTRPPATCYLRSASTRKRSSTSPGVRVWAPCNGSGGGPGRGTGSGCGSGSGGGNGRGCGRGSGGGVGGSGSGSGGGAGGGTGCGSGGTGGSTGSGRADLGRGGSGRANSPGASWPGTAGSSEGSAGTRK